MLKPIYSFLPKDIEGIESLAELALDLRWSWNHLADEVWKQLDPALWSITHNPWVVLQTVSRDQFQHVMADPEFREKVDSLLKSKDQAMSDPAWFQQHYPNSSLNCVAYFSMEFMLSEALPIYSGGLGNVAGDQLKAASDLGIPVVGIGLLYQQGYFRQEIDSNGSQLALFPYNDPGQIPVSPLRDENGEWLRLQIGFPGYSVWIRVWQVQVGRVRLYLLDSNDTANFPIHRGITGELYGGGSELRLKQELLLGIGGWRLMMALGLNPRICHLNEGHAAFAILERAYSFMTETGLPFEKALFATRSGNLFTTHTAVPAGFDLFPPDRITHYLGDYARQKLGISNEHLLALGRSDPSNEKDFNMAFLAIHGCGSINGVSNLHGKVSRKIFEPLFPKWPQNEIPIGHITNGIHVPTWNSKEADDLWTQYCGKNCWLGFNKALEQIRQVSDEQLWKMRIDANISLLNFAGEQLSRQMLGSGHSSEIVENAKHLFNPNILTLGFARRFTSYKRPNLLLHNPQRLLALLTNQAFPVQLIISGKAHPDDLEGQELIREWMQFIHQNNFQPRVMFLSDYDMEMSQNLVQGVDVWINTPRRPWEASGTSGMKVLVNGGINLSELDGWWAEAYSPEVGWAIGDGKEHDDIEVWDALEANELYTLLEQKIIPEFYDRNADGIPTAWIARMRESMARLTPRFSAERTVREYTENHYLPASTTYLERTDHNGEKAGQLYDTILYLEEKWDTMHFGEVKVEIKDDQYHFKVSFYFDEVNPDLLQMELFANDINVGNSIVQIMIRGELLENESNAYYFSASVNASRPVTDFTPRVIPLIPTVSVPLEISQVTWEH